jgi:hypothetical protein
MLAFGVTVFLTSTGAFADGARPIEVESAEARVSVQIEPRTATLLRRDSFATAVHVAKGFEELCSGACKLKLKAGTYGLALALSESELTETQLVPIPQGDSQLLASYESKSGRRLGGWVLIGTSPITWLGTGMVIKAARGGEAITAGQGVLITGLAVAQLALGIYLVATGGDSLGFKVVPLLPTSSPSALSRREALASRLGVNGVGVQLAF